MGNRGILHDASGRLGAARWRHPHWVCCVLSFKGRRRALMAPNRYTELFFLDEAVALAAGHRPCAECRRADYLRFRKAWEAAVGPAPRTGDIDRRLHAARIDGRAQRRHTAAWADLPDGVFALHDGQAVLLLRNMLHPFAPDGYAPALPRPTGRAIVLTPAPTVATLRAGYALDLPRDLAALAGPAPKP